MNCFLTPMAADLTFAVDDVESEDPQLFKGTAASTQVYALVDATFGAGTTIGPFLSGFLYDKGNWGIAVGVLAALSFSAAIPTVSQNFPIPTLHVVALALRHHCHRPYLLESRDSGSEENRT